jgi:2-oxoisovalerate dehydrogenase E1 component beta subunit
LAPNGLRRSVTETWTLARALNRAMQDALADDPRVLVFGEDIGRAGGIFGVTTGLQAEFGSHRVFDTPISESGIVGAAVGLAFGGWKSVVEMQFGAFSYPAMEQVIDHVAKMRERVRGRVDMPITIRMPAFGGLRGKEQHGESPETYFIHTAGLKVVTPSNAADGYALLRSAISDPDPVIVLEPKALYSVEEETDLAQEGSGIEGARIARDGDSCTIVAYGSMVPRSLEAAELLSGEGIRVRVLDLRALSPLDDDLLSKCASDTGRMVVVHEAPRTLGLGAEVAARVTELAFDQLAGPVIRVAGWDVPYPPASLEDVYRPTVERIAEATRRAASY